MNKNKIFNIIQEDIEQIEKQLSNRNGSGELWSNLETKYSILLPDIITHIKVGSKIGTIGLEFDFRPELKKLKTALLTWISINEDELEIEGTYIHNKAKDSIHNIPRATEKELHNLIIESKIYISKEDYNQKKIGLEKIWDAFERLKTIKGIDKKISINNIIAHITNGDKEISQMLNNEFRELTRIGNSYSIRHSEITQKKLPNSQFIEYLYFRMLSLISCILNLI